jgi:hypothetical protein
LANVQSTVYARLVKRRSFLKGAGVVTVVVVGGGVWRAYDHGVFSAGEGPAYEPWKNWRDPNDGPLNLVRAAILAASPHNTQPWLFKVSSSSIELHIDTQRNVGALDPYLREEHIGIGCALENLMLAAPANGYAPRRRSSQESLSRLPPISNHGSWPEWISRPENVMRVNCITPSHSATPIAVPTTPIGGSHLISWKRSAVCRARTRR